MEDTMAQSQSPASGKVDPQGASAQPGGNGRDASDGGVIRDSGCSRS